MRRKKDKDKKKGIKNDIAKTIRNAIKDNLEESKKDIINKIENEIEKDFSQRIEKLEAKVEKNVEDFLLKKFDSMIYKFSENVKNNAQSKYQPGKTEDISNIREHIKEIMDIQEEMISKMHQKSSQEPFDVSEITNQLNELSSFVNANGREIKSMVLQIEDLKKKRETVVKSDAGLDGIRKDLEEKFFDINKKLEQSRMNLMGEISRVENQKVLPPPPAPIAGEDSTKKVKEVEERLLSRITELEKGIYELKQRKPRTSGAIVLE